MNTLLRALIILRWQRSLLMKLCIGAFYFLPCSLRKWATDSDEYDSGSTLPYCHTLNFISDTSDTYTMFGCDNWKATAIGVALPTAGAVITTQSSPVSSGSPQRTTSGLTGISPSATSTQTSPLTAPVSTSSVPSGVNMAAAIGGALGGFASVVVAVLAVYKFWSKKNKSKEPLNPWMRSLYRCEDGYGTPLLQYPRFAGNFLEIWSLQAQLHFNLTNWSRGIRSYGSLNCILPTIHQLEKVAL